jgi:hypothetical protein
LRTESTLVLRFTALGAIAFVFACVAHEAIGHAGACLLTGGKVELLTSTFFRCRPGSRLADAAGPIMNSGLAAIAFFLLRARKRSATARAFLALMVAFNAMWGFGYLSYSAVTGVGDWAFLIGSDGPSQSWAWRILIALVGVWLYAGAMRVIAPHLPSGLPLVAAYLAAALVAMTSVLLQSGPLLPAAREALLEGALAPIGLLYVAVFPRATALNSSALLGDTLVRGFWPCTIGIIIAFLALMGPGYGSA